MTTKSSLGSQTSGKPSQPPARPRPSKHTQPWEKGGIEKSPPPPWGNSAADEQRCQNQGGVLLIDMTFDGLACPLAEKSCSWLFVHGSSFSLNTASWGLYNCRNVALALGTCGCVREWFRWKGGWHWHHQDNVGMAWAGGAQVTWRGPQPHPKPSNHRLRLAQAV